MRVQRRVHPELPETGEHSESRPEAAASIEERDPSEAGPVRPEAIRYSVVILKRPAGEALIHLHFGAEDTGLQGGQAERGRPARQVSGEERAVAGAAEGTRQAQGLGEADGAVAGVQERAAAVAGGQNAEEALEAGPAAAHGGLAEQKAIRKSRAAQTAHPERPEKHHGKEPERKVGGVTYVSILEEIKELNNRNNILY